MFRLIVRLVLPSVVFEIEIRVLDQRDLLSSLALMEKREALFYFIDHRTDVGMHNEWGRGV